MHSSFDIFFPQMTTFHWNTCRDSGETLALGSGVLIRIASKLSHQSPCNVSPFLLFRMVNTNKCDDPISDLQQLQRREPIWVRGGNQRRPSPRAMMAILLTSDQSTCGKPSVSEALHCRVM